MEGTLSANPNLRYPDADAPALPAVSRYAHAGNAKSDPVVKLDNAIKSAKRRRLSDTKLASTTRAAISERLGNINRALKVRVSSGVATLEGDIETGNQKSLAEETARRVAGIRWVVNRVRIVAPSKLEMRTLYR